MRGTAETFLPGTCATDRPCPTMAQALLDQRDAARHQN
jgi:hypothetical protein